MLDSVWGVLVERDEGVQRERLVARGDLEVQRRDV